MSIVVVAASCASGVALVLILIGVASAVRCRCVRAGSRRRRTSGGGGGGAGAASKRLPVGGAAAASFPELSPFDTGELDGDVGLAMSPKSTRLGPATELVDRERPTMKRPSRARVVMNGVKSPARSRQCSDESSVRTPAHCLSLRGPTRAYDVYFITSPTT